MSEPEELYPVEMVYHHNRYASILYDVDGNILTGESGRQLNVFQEELKDMLISRKIRFMHYMSKEPTYSYFIVDAEQLGRFHIERTEGSPEIGKKYHVYIDY
jgi:hypothetical protein